MVAIPTSLLVAGLIAGSAVFAAEPGPAPAAAAIEGTWDLIWQTRRGPRQSGYLVLRVTGSQVVGELHGQGSVTARGALTDRGFTLRGSRMLVSYTVEGRLAGTRLEGAIRTMSVERRFTGTRR